MSAFLDSFTKYIKENNINVYRVAEIEGDGEARVTELAVCNPCQNSYSVSKFFTLTAVGMLWDEGKLGMEERLTDILAPYCPHGMDDKWNSITIEMVIKHHTGLPEGYLDIDCDDATKFGDDYLGYVLSTPVGDTERYSYTDADFYLLSRVVAERAGVPMCRYLWDKLFLPLGFREVAWSCCPLNHAMGATGLYIRTEDTVKLGALYLNRGVHGSKRLLSEAWVDTVTERGYLPYYTKEAYGHGGMRGQMLLVLPNEDLAVAWHGCHGESKLLKDFISNYFDKNTED